MTVSVSVSTLGLMKQNVLHIKDVQASLSVLSTQLATGKKSLDLSAYTLTDGGRLLDLRSLITKKQSFLNSISSIEPQMKVYDSALTSLETVANDTLSLINQATGIEQANNTAAATQFEGLLNQVEYYLNQKIGSRYIFGGARFTTQPVRDLSALLATPPTSTSLVANPVLPDYDTDAPGSDASTYVKSSTKVDDGYTVTYGVISNDDAFQELILALRWAHAATQETDDADFQTGMNNARGLIVSAINDLRAVHGQVASNIAQIRTTKEFHNDFIASASGQIADIQNADSAEVATKISFAQAQLEASYSVTGKIASLSLVNYL